MWQCMTKVIPLFFSVKSFKYFKKVTIINIHSELGITPLYCACIRGSKNSVDLLLDLGANINSKDNEDNNCLHYAINSNNPNLLKKLLIRGANKEEKNIKNETPLDLARQNTFQKLIKILSTKNNFISNPCSNEHEIVGIRSSHNNITLFIIIPFMGLGKWIYISRMYYLKEGDLKLDVVTFIYEIETIKEIYYDRNYQNFTNCTIDDTTKYQYSINRHITKAFLENLSELFVPNIFGYNNLDEINYTGLGISVLDTVILFFILKFMRFSSRIFKN